MKKTYTKPLIDIIMIKEHIMTIQGSAAKDNELFNEGDDEGDLAKKNVFEVWDVWDD